MKKLFVTMLLIGSVSVAYNTKKEVPVQKVAKISFVTPMHDKGPA